MTRSDSRSRPWFPPKEDVVDVFADEGAEAEELAVDAVEDGLEEVPLPRVLRVKQLQQLQRAAAQRRAQY